MKKEFSVKLARSSILEKLQEKRSAATSSSTDRYNSRGDSMLEFVRKASESQIELFRFNDMTDFDVDC